MKNESLVYILLGLSRSTRPPSSKSSYIQRLSLFSFKEKTQPSTQKNDASKLKRVGYSIIYRKWWRPITTFTFFCGLVQQLLFSPSNNTTTTREGSSFFKIILFNILLLFWCRMIWPYVYRQRQRRQYKGRKLDALSLHFQQSDGGPTLLGTG